MKWIVIAIVLASTACSGDEVSVTPAVPEVPAEIDLEIGVLDGPPEYVFGRISGLAEGPEGNLFVADAQNHLIRSFAGDGTFLRSFGREGQGPGEFGRPCCIAFGPSGRLWVRDSRNRRYQGIEVGAASEGDPATVRMNHHDGGLFAALTFQPNGSLVDVGHHSAAGGELGLWRFTVALDGTVLDQVMVEEPSAEDLGTAVREEAQPGGVARYFFPQPFGPESLVAHGPEGRWATAVSSEYVVTLLRGSQSIEIRGSVLEGPELTPSERDWADERLDSYVERGGGRLADYPPVPERKPPLADLFFDDVGRLWVELSVPAGSDRRADVYSDEGVLLERRVWPGSVRLGYPAWVGETRALGIAADSLGVQRVVRLRF